MLSNVDFILHYIWFIRLNVLGSASNENVLGLRLNLKLVAQLNMSEHTRVMAMNRKRHDKDIPEISDGLLFVIWLLFQGEIAGYLFVKHYQETK